MLVIPATAPQARAQGDMKSASASSGRVHARLTWMPDPDTNGFLARDIRLQIQRGAGVALRARVVKTRFAVEQGRYAPAPPVQVVDLDGDGEPEIIITLFSGGASCCVVGRVYHYSAHSYAASELVNFGEAGYGLKSAGHKRAFVSAVQHWAYGAHACAGYPLQIIRFSRGRLADVTGSFRGRLRADARRWLGLWARARRCESRPPLDFLAAALADLYRLHDAQGAQLALGRAHHRGDFNADSEQRFIAETRRFARHIHVLRY